MPLTSVEATCDGDRLAGFPFEEHNADMRAAWAAMDAGTPFRTPTILGLNTRYFILTPWVNRENVSFQRYMEDPDAMFDMQLRAQRWQRFNLLQDAELGLPDEWVVTPDFQNVYEAGWLGCSQEYSAGQVPATLPAYPDGPEPAMDNGIPDPFGGLLERGLRYYQRFQERAASETYLDRPIRAGLPGWGCGSDGVMTVACNLCGPEWVCMAMASEPDRLHRFFDFLAEATIRRITAWRERFGHPVRRDRFYYADDSIALVSVKMYRDHILPYHRRVFDAFATDTGRGIHLCGDATRHFPTIHEELGVVEFDTGYPVDFARVRGDVGTEVRINGGPTAETVRFGPAAAVDAEAVHILASGVLEGGRFVLREGNNLAPETPAVHTEALYRAAREHGVGRGWDGAEAVQRWLDGRNEKDDA